MYSTSIGSSKIALAIGLFFFFQLLSLNNAMATTYTFTGSGDWSVIGNWDANGIPPSTLTSGNTIIINPSGFCQLTTDLIIQEGSTFTINPSKDFRTGNFDITNSGTFNMLGDINSYGGFDLTNTSTGLINKNGTIYVNGSLNNAGTIHDIGGTWFITGTSGTNTGTIELNNNSQISIYSGRDFNNSGTLTVKSPASIHNVGTFVNNNTLQINGTFVNGDMDDFGIFSNNGTVQINGTFSNGDMYNPSTFTNDGILMGTGTFEQNGTFSNNSTGILAPGASPGKLTISGDFDLGSGTYTAEINGPGQGTDYDWIAVSGTATIGPDSKLNIVFGPGYTPTVGTTFDILTASTVSGTFDPSNITISGGGVGSVDVTYAGGNMMQLEVASVLPVELVSFTAKAQNNKVLLHWETASEQNNKGFEVQRSSNGHSWETLDFVSGNGTAFESHTYIFMDKSPLRGMNYYRLRQLDYDNKEEYSPIKTVKLNGDGGISIYPNPATSGATLLLNAAYAGEAQLTIYNAFGKQISTHPLILNNGDSHLNLDLSGLQAGIYMLDIKAGDERWNERLIIK